MTAPVTFLPSASSAVTTLPIIPLASVSCCACSSDPIAVFSEVSWSSELNWAIWAMNAWSSIGFMGSWCCSWAISSFMNSSLPSSDGSLLLDALVVRAEKIDVALGASAAPVTDAIATS